MTVPEAAAPTADMLVVSGCGEGGVPGGGVFALDRGAFRRLDARPTTGLAFDRAGGRWLRALSHRDRARSYGEVLEVGLERGRRVERVLGKVLDAHDVLGLGDERLCVATHENAIVDLASGRPRTKLQLPGEADSWHLNCLALVGGELFASAFRRGGAYRQWEGSGLRGAGLVFSLEGGHVVADGLSAPHSPRFVEGCWVVCNSATHELVAIDPRDPRTVVRSVDVGGFSRGLAVGSEHFFVGVSARRHVQGSDADSSRVVVVDRGSWQILDELAVPVPELYDCCLVPAHAVELLALDHGADGEVAAEADATPGPRDTAALSLRAELPRRIAPGAVVYLNAVLEHQGGDPLSTGGEFPLQASYRWIASGGRAPVMAGSDEPLRTALPRVLPPKGEVPIELLVRAPAVPGRYTLRLALVEEFRQWLDAVDPSAYSAGEVEVG